MNECTIIIFGATGDLTKRKLLPALYRLVHAKKLSSNFLIVGIAREEATSDDILKNAEPFIENPESTYLEQIRSRFIYEKADVTQLEDFVRLKSVIESYEKKYNLPGKRIFYCATAAAFFCDITAHLAASGLAHACAKQDHAWHRIVYEKPFGHDLASARKINQCIESSFNEHQIYRIDHYLMKEIVGNIALVRFTNCVLEPLWNNRYIDAVQIILSETVGVETRGMYYDRYGAVADVMQNHMLEILALLAMESPEKLTGEYIRSERANVLAKVKAIDALLGQYDGYTQEPHVPPSSQTETFAVALLRIDNPRWAGVPFYLKTGKQLDKKETIIHIKFKQVECLLTKQCPSESNYLTIQINPEAVMSLRLNVKKPGSANEVVPVSMEFSHTKFMGTITAQAYEILFEEIMRGEESISVRFDEIESAWNIVDHLRSLRPPLYPYRKGSTGPTQADAWALKHGMRWRT